MTRRRRNTAWALLAALLLGGAAAILPREAGPAAGGASTAAGASTSRERSAPGGALSREAGLVADGIASPGATSASASIARAATASAGAPGGVSSSAESATAREDREGPVEPESPDAEEARTGLLVTVVDDATGAPVKRAAVQLGAHDDTELRLALSDDDGEARFPAATPGRHRLECRHEGYAGLAFDERVILVVPYGELEVAIEGRHLRDGLHLRLLRGPTISGLVLDAMDHPVAATVVAANIWEETWKAAAGADGRFRMAGIGADLPAHLRVVAHAGDRGRGECAVTLTRESFEAEVVIRIGPPCALEGIVIGPDGAPRPDAVVQAHPVDLASAGLVQLGDADGSRVVVGSTGPGGRFRIEGLAAGPVDLLAGAPDLGTRIRRGVLARPGVGWVGELRLEAGLSLAGRVVDARGRAVTETATIVASAESGHRVEAKTDGLGRFRLAGLRDLEYEVTCYTGFLVPLEPRTVAARSGEEAVFVVPDAFRIVLTVETEPGRAPVRRVEAMILSESGNGSGWSGHLLANGTFEIAPVFVGSARVELSFAEYPNAVIERPEPGPDGACRATVRCAAGGTVRGRAVDEAGRPLAGAWVATARSARMTPELFGDTQADEEGRFRFSNVPPGALHVRVASLEFRADGRLLSRREGTAGPITVARDVEVDAGEIVARPVTPAPEPDAPPPPAEEDR